MALRGNLRDFSLPDVFQLVTFSRKTGVLRIVRSDSAQGSVWFREGDVFFASSNWHSEPLGERLVRAQRITSQALVRALEARGREPQGGRRLGQILVDEGYITEAVLETFVSEQIEDTIFDLMRWDEGEFDFEAMPAVVEEDIGLSVSIENIVMEGSRRLEEWGRIKKKIPSMDVVFKMATAPGEGTFEISLKPMEWQLLLLTDGSRSVAELAHATQRTDFDVARIIYGLLSAGLLEFASDEDIAASTAERTEREGRLAAISAQARAAEAMEQQAALERETRLAQEAAQRWATQAGQAQPQTELVTPPAGGVPSAVEEPEFLGHAAAAPSAEDQAVLDRYMGAVLGQPQAPPPPVAPAPAAAPPYVAVEEPAFMSAAHAQDTEMQLIPVSSIEDILPSFAANPVASQVAMNAVAAAFEPTVATAPAPDFERDLRALGLGELPAQRAATPIEAPLQPAAEPMSQVADALAAAPAAASAPDFSQLLESLDADAEQAASALEQEGFDVALLQDDTTVAAGVISTDGFLDESSIGGFGFSGGLTDELSALTGVERRQPARPQASVNAIPDSGSTLQRDSRVDRETVLRIIDGIKNL